MTQYREKCLQMYSKNNKKTTFLTEMRQNAIKNVTIHSHQ